MKKPTIEQVLLELIKLGQDFITYLHSPRSTPLTTMSRLIEIGEELDALQEKVKRMGNGKT